MIGNFYQKTMWISIQWISSFKQWLLNHLVIVRVEDFVIQTISSTVVEIPHRLKSREQPLVKLSWIATLLQRSLVQAFLYWVDRYLPHVKQSAAPKIHVHSHSTEECLLIFFPLHFKHGWKEVTSKHLKITGEIVKQWINSLHSTEIKDMMLS